MDWGGIISGAIGGGAKAIGEVADLNLKTEAENERFRRQAAWDVQKANAAMDRKLQLDEQMAQRTEKRYTDAADKAETRGRDIGLEKDATSMQGARANMPNEGDYANVPVSRTDIESLPPAARKIYEEQGMVPKTTESGIIANQMQAAREGGAPKALRDDLRKNYQDTSKGEADARKGSLEMQKLDRKEAMDREREDRKDARQDKQIDALQARTEAALSGREGRDGVKRTLDMIDSQRKYTTDEARELRRAMEAELKDANRTMDKEEAAAIRARYAKPLAEIDAKRRKLDADFDGVRSVLGAGGSSGGSSAAPSEGAAGRGIVNSAVGGDTAPPNNRDAIVGNEKSIALLKKQPLNQGETQASRDEQIAMIERENARMQRGGGANPGVGAPVATPVAQPGALRNPLKTAPPDGTPIRNAAGQLFIVRNGKPEPVGAQ